MILVSDGIAMIFNCDNRACGKRVMRLCKNVAEHSLTAPSGRSYLFCGQNCFTTFGPIARDS